MFSFKKMCKGVWSDLSSHLHAIISFFLLVAIPTIIVGLMLLIPREIADQIHHVMGVFLGIVTGVIIVSGIIYGLYSLMLYLKSKGE